MGYLAVDNDFRGMKIDRKLVQALLDFAKENGYENMYLETSGPSGTKWDAVHLYENMNFEYLRSKKHWSVFALITGIHSVSYIQRIK